MFEKADCTVTYLQRIEFSPLKLNDLPLGEFRALTQEEEYIKLDRDKSTFKSHRDFSSEKEITFKHF